MVENVEGAGICQHTGLRSPEGDQEKRQPQAVTVNQELLGQPGEEDQEIGINVQTLVLLVPIDKVELARISKNYDFGPPEAYCPGLPSDADKKDDDATDVPPRTGLRLLEKTKKIKDT